MPNAFGGIVLEILKLCEKKKKMNCWGSCNEKVIFFILFIYFIFLEGNDS